MRLSYAVFALFASFFLLLTIIPPILASEGVFWAEGFANSVYSPFCHQLPERSLFILGIQMPVCARCFGIYAGIAVGALLYPFISDGKVPDRWVIFAAAAPLVLDGATQLIGLRESFNLLRVATGLVFGSAVPFYIIPVFDEILGGRRIFIRGRRLL